MNTTATAITATTWIRRLGAGVALAAVPALIAIGTATASHADTASNGQPGTSATASAHHAGVPKQSDGPKPGTSEHHHHQHNHRR